MITWRARRRARARSLSRRGAWHSARRRPHARQLPALLSVRRRTEVSLGGAWALGPSAPALTRFEPAAASRRRLSLRAQRLLSRVPTPLREISTRGSQTLAWLLANARGQAVPTPRSRVRRVCAPQVVHRAASMVSARRQNCLAPRRARRLGQTPSARAGCPRDLHLREAGPGCGRSAEEALGA